MKIEDDGWPPELHDNKYYTGCASIMVYSRWQGPKCRHCHDDVTIKIMACGWVKKYLFGVAPSVDNCLESGDYHPTDKDLQLKDLAFRYYTTQEPIGVWILMYTATPLTASKNNICAGHSAFVFRVMSIGRHGMRGRRGVAEWPGQAPPGGATCIYQLYCLKLPLLRIEGDRRFTQSIWGYRSANVKVSDNGSRYGLQFAEALSEVGHLHVLVSCLGVSMRLRAQAPAPLAFDFPSGRRWRRVA
ncbi:jg12517 [Pararge aegeria aegeria]|uniref:Jg12517 protein n=1 Tax=Pararge aegeria aegeria TaxID=348720 RepID=A0A8S4R2S5_9NEOP|nr:jg12517 [Pararge aegeria aegeria]